MKRTTLALLALGAFVAPVACTKQELPDTSRAIVPVTISLAGYESGSMPTKGIAEEISSTLPASMTLSVTEKTSGKTYEVTTGTTCRLPVGTYSVAGATQPEVRQGIYGTTRYLSDKPKVVVEDEIVVTEGQTAYSVTATYQCYVLAVYTSEVKAWTGTFKGNAGAEAYHLAADGLWWVFVVGDFSADYPFYTSITLTDNTKLDYTFYTRDLQPGGILAEYGKWYLLRPSGGGNLQMGSMSLNLPAWTAGN